jgi:threonine dehydrogenase-like Zn-dependent dehydrogenase
LTFALGLYLSDVLPTSYHAVTYTGVKKGDTVAIWGLGPIGFMSSFWSFHKGAKRVIAIDNNWRTDYAKIKIPGLETINYDNLPSGQTVPGRIHELIPGGVDVCIDATGGEYGKSAAHKVELASGLEQDTSEMVNEAIYATRPFGKVGIIADYVGCKDLILLVFVTQRSAADETFAVTNHFNIGALMELGITLVGCGQCPVHRCESIFFIPSFQRSFTERRLILL